MHTYPPTNEYGGNIDPNDLRGLAWVTIAICFAIAAAHAFINIVL